MVMVMDNRHPIRPLRWFLLAWESLVYVWGIVYLCGVDLLLGDQVHPAFLVALHVHLGAVLAFTALMLLQGALLWAALAGQLPPRLYWLSFLALAGLVWTIGLVVQQENVVLSLYLALTVGASGLLTGARRVTLVAGGYLTLAILSGIWSLHGWQDWNAFLIIFWFKSDYAALILFAVGYLVLYTHQTRAHAQLQAAHLQLQTAAARIEELTLMTERQRLARDLHDTLAQGVAGFIMQVEAANAQLAQHRVALVQDILQQALASARATLAEARGAIDDLRTLTAAPDLAALVEQEIQRFRHATGLPCTVELTSLALVPAALYEPTVRAVREGLTNVARHAQASHVWVRVVSRDQMLAVEVQDDGIGFDPPTLTARAGHYGLTGLRERAHLAGGALEVTSAPGTGTTIRLCIPRPVESRPR
jgi:NarL family two-component system sensor histidine kinase YdfH